MKGKYYHTTASVTEYIKAAEGHNGKSLIEKLQGFLPANSSLLEIGSGPGSDFQILAKTYNVFGSDHSQLFVDHLKSKFPDGNFLQLDATTLTIKNKFDGIYSNKVLHHLTNEELEESIKRQYETLNQNGIVCHSFWKGDGSEMFKGMFVNYHSINDIKAKLSGSFDILLTNEYKEFEESDSFLVIARKKSFN